MAEGPRIGTVIMVGLSVVGGGLALAIQTSPETAVSNAAKWVATFSGYLPDWPRWVDTLVTVVALLPLAALVFLLIWRKLRSPIEFIGVRKANEVPDQHNAAIRLVIKNRSSNRLTGLTAQVTNVEPPLNAWPQEIHLPLTLATKTRLDAFRAGNEPRPNVPFNLNAGAQRAHRDMPAWQGRGVDCHGYAPGR